MEFNDTDGIPALSKVANIVKRLLRDPRKAKDMSPAEINTLWAPTWGWLDKFLLFWSTPVVLFLANSIIQMTLTTAFTWFLVNTYPSDDKIYVGTQLPPSSASGTEIVSRPRPVLTVCLLLPAIRARDAGLLQRVPLGIAAPYRPFPALASPHSLGHLWR